MKKLFFYIYLLLLISCQKKDNNSFPIIIEISNYPKDYLLLAQDTIGFGLTTKIDSIGIDKGRFYLNKGSASNSVLIFDDNNKPFNISLSRFLTQSITIQLDFSKPDSISFRGDQARFIQYDIDQKEYWVEIYEKMAVRYPILASRNNHKKEYHQIQDSITDLRIKFLENYFKDSELENQTEFIEFEEKALIYSNLFYRMSGQKKEIIQQLDFYPVAKKDSLKLTYSDQVSFSNKQLFSLYPYREFTQAFIMNDIRLHYPNGDQSSYEYYLSNGLERIDKWFTNPETNSIEKIIFINELINTAKIFNASINVEAFKKAIDNLVVKSSVIDCKSIINENLDQLEEFMNRLSVGKKAPNFMLLDKNGKEYRLSEMENKTIFIDVWASWCGPCISSFPKWNEFVQSNQENKNLEFLTISIDNTNKEWEKGLAKHDLKGLKLFAGNGGSKAILLRNTI